VSKICVNTAEVSELVSSATVRTWRKGVLQNRRTLSTASREPMHRSATGRTSSRRANSTDETSATSNSRACNCRASTDGGAYTTSTSGDASSVSSQRVSGAALI
jgi:hypothetical protein